MDYLEDVNCYCFNPVCITSIFNTYAFAVVKMPLLAVLSEDIHCSVCGSKLIAKPLLEVKILISALNDTVTADV